MWLEEEEEEERQCADISSDWLTQMRLPTFSSPGPPVSVSLMLLLPLLLLSEAAAPTPKCPPSLHAKCTCNIDMETRVTVFCSDIPAAAAFATFSNAALDSLRLENCTMNTLTKALPLSSLRSLEIVNCGTTMISDALRDIPDGSLIGLPSLRQLRVEDNNICQLSSNALNESKATLELLDVSGNCFSVIPAQTLRNSLKLMYLDLSSNKITEISNFNLMNLPVLRELRLNDNLLNKIQPMAFMNVPELQYLYMRNNLIADLDGNRLQAFKQLEILDVTNNMLSKLPSFKDLSNLKQIRLDGNLITQVDTLAFTSNPKLQLISMQNNAISVVARNSFDSLDQLVILLLSNNSIKSIERGMLDGMRNLQQLNLRNNSLTEIDKESLSALRQLTTLDLSHNQIKKIAKGAFEKQAKLFWLDLSNNRLRTFEKGSFEKRISNVLLSGNPLECDEALGWFVQWLVLNRVRTFLPAQQDITCAGPPKFAGVRLKELMMKKANETIASATKNLGLQAAAGGQRSILSNFLPSLSGQGLANGLNGLPVLNSLTNAIPSLRNVPGLGGNQAGSLETRQMNSAIDQFAGPLVRFATGGQPVAADLEQLIQSIPNLFVDVPGYGNIDVAKLPPSLIAHVLRGGQVPGIPKETLDRIMQTYMAKMSEMANAAQRGERPADFEKYLPPLEKLPPNMVSTVLQGRMLPTLNESQTRVIKEYYTAQIPIGIPTLNQGSASGAPPVFPFSPQAVEMMRLLPPGYNMSRIPVPVMEAITRGEVPDLNLLPEDLQEHLKLHSNKMLSMFSDQNSNVTIEDLLAKLPRWERPVLPTYSPYDINQLNNDLVHEEEQAEKSSRLRLYTAIALGAIGAVTIVVIIALAVYMKRTRGGPGQASHVSPLFRRASHNDILGGIPPPQSISTPKPNNRPPRRDRPSYIANTPPTPGNLSVLPSQSPHSHQA